MTEFSPMFYDKDFNATATEKETKSKPYKESEDISQSCFEKTELNKMGDDKYTKSKTTATEKLVGRVSMDILEHHYIGRLRLKVFN